MRKLWVVLPMLVVGACGGKNGGPGGPSNCTLPATITADMTLTTACAPWHVASAGTTVAGTASPVLTIQPGVTLAFDHGAFLSIGTSGPGGLVAVGSGSAPITFTSSAATPAAGDWASVALADQTLATSTIGFANFQYGGAQNGDGYSYSHPAGALMVYSASALKLSLHDLAFANDLANGLVLDGMQVGYAAGSGHLTVKDWGSGDAPFVISADAASTLPVTLTTPIGAPGARVDVICGNDCTPGTGGEAIVDVTQTWPAIPIPYLVDGATGTGLQIEGKGNSHATLTIAAPNTLEFKSGGEIFVDPNGTGQGDLVANGAITFTSDSPAPSPGAWAGIHFVVTTAGLSGSSLTGATLEYGGGVYTLPAGSGSGCNGAVGVIYVDANGNSSRPVGPTISGCTFASYPAADDGIIAADISSVSSAAYSANTFSGQAVCSL
ncbi:MAG: hypothetical protein ACYCWW_06150 [Deltaproteobacteria bacterium]